MQTKRPVCESFALLTFQFYSRCRQCLQAPSLTIVCNLLFKQCQTMFTCLLQTITRLQFCITLAASISLSLSIVSRNPRTRHPCPDKMYPQQRVAAVAVTGYDRRLPCYHLKVMHQQLVTGNHGPKVSWGQTAPCTHL